MLTANDFNQIYKSSWSGRMKEQIKEGCTSGWYMRHESLEDNKALLPLIDSMDIQLFYGKLSKRSGYAKMLKVKHGEDFLKYYKHCYFLAVAGFEEVAIIRTAEKMRELDKDMLWDFCYSHYAHSVQYRTWRELIGIEADFPKTMTEKEIRQDNFDKMVGVMKIFAEGASKKAETNG